MKRRLPAGQPLLFGVSVGYPNSAGYPLPGGEQCTALVAGVPLDTISLSLSLGIDDSFVFSHIIGKDGGFVVKSGNLSADNFYDWLAGCRFKGSQPQEITAQMREAFDAGQNYAIVAQADSQRHLYCSALP